MSGHKGTIAILTGGGDVPGLNPAIRALTVRALREGYRVLGMRRGWAGLVDLVPDKEADNSEHVQVLTQEIVNRAGYASPVRTPRGRDIFAACGQLKSASERLAARARAV